MKNRTPPPHFMLYAGLCLLILATTTLAQSGVGNRGVLKRMTTMTTARTAVETLANMMAGRVRFSSTQARAARRNLISATRSIPSVFRRPHTDPLSRARPEIWWQWDDFKTRARTAKKAAQALRVDRLGALRSSLPDLINACLGCHQTYRKPP